MMTMLVRGIEALYETRVAAAQAAGFSPEAAHVHAFMAVKQIGAEALAELRFREAIAAHHPASGNGRGHARRDARHLRERL